MGTKFQAPNSQYNKNAEFARLFIDTAFEATLSEAIAVDVDENKFVVFAYIQSAAGVESYGDKDFAFTAQPCMFDVHKKDHKGYGDKDMTQSPLMTAISYAVIEDIGFNVPFSAEITGANSRLQTAITEKQWKGKELGKEALLELIQGQAMEYSKIEALDKLKDLKIDAPKGFTKGGGMNPKKVLEARLEFVQDCAKPDSSFRKLAAELGYDNSEVNATLCSYLNSVMN